MSNSNPSIGRVPPQNLEAEQSVLGSILLDNEALYQVAEILQEKDFYREAHRLIFKSIMALLDRDEPADLVTLTNELKQTIHHTLREALGLNVQVSLLAPGEAPRSEGGKLKRVFDNRVLK